MLEIWREGLDLEVAFLALSLQWSSHTAMTKLLSRLERPGFAKLLHTPNLLTKLLLSSPAALFLRLSLSLSAVGSGLANSE